MLFTYNVLIFLLYMYTFTSAGSQGTPKANLVAASSSGGSSSESLRSDIFNG